MLIILYYSNNIQSVMERSFLTIFFKLMIKIFIELIVITIDMLYHLILEE